MPNVSFPLTVLAAALIAPTATAQTDKDPDLKAINAYQLSMPRYKQYLTALLNLAAAGERDPKLASQLKTSGQLSIDQSVKLYDGDPAARRAIADAGLTNRDFVLTQKAALHTGMAHHSIKNNLINGDSAVKAGTVSQANLDFYRKNEAEITRLTEEYAAKIPPALRE